MRYHQTDVRTISTTYFFLVRTTTAVETAPFLTFPFGVASLTATTILSPTEA
jgi:hypothetical protein